MDIYLIKKNGAVIPHTDLAAMEEIDGVKAPDKTVTTGAWEAAGGTAFIDDAGNIQLGIPAAEKARQGGIAALEAEEAALQKELDGKDYKVTQASERGQVLAEIDPQLHERREGCRARINEIRERLEDLKAV